MNIFKKFIILIKEKVFNIKPKFNIEIKECWFSTDWLYIRYTDGYNWYHIVEDAIDIDENKWDKYKVCTRFIKITDIESFMKHNDLSTFEKCEQFCKNVYDWVNEHNERAYSEYLNKSNHGRTFVKNFNNKIIDKLRHNDPVYNCPVFLNEGCAHVDGLLCNYPNCNIIKENIISR